MPTYDYACPKCEKVFEVFHGMNEKPRVLCPDCKARARKQLGTGAGILFKGSGFYQTDYRSSNYHSSAKADKAAATSAPEAAPKAEAKADSKPEAKPTK